MPLIDPEDQRDAKIAELARKHVAAIATNIRTGHEQTLFTMAEEFAFRVSQAGVTEHLIRAAMSVGPLGAGQMLIDLIQKGIDCEAENEAVKEVERMEAAVPSKDRERMAVMQVRREVAAAYGCGVAA